MSTDYHGIFALLLKIQIQGTSFRTFPEDMLKAEFMNQIPDDFDINIGKAKNNSFRYFVEKF